MYVTCYKLVTNTTQIYVMRNFSNHMFSVSFPFRCKQPPRQWYCLKCRVSNFHTTRTRMNFPIFFVLSVAVGYSLRCLWFILSPMKRKECLKLYKNNRFKIYGTLTVISFVMVAYCSTFLKQDPVVNRPRLSLVNDEELIRDAQLTAKSVVRSKDNVVPLDDPMYSRIVDAMLSIARSNEPLFKHSDWRITIVKSTSGKNPRLTVMVLPDTTIIAFSDILKLVENDDQLKFIMAHEMAHHMLLHTREVASLKFLGDIACCVIALISYTFYPCLTAFISCMLAYTLFRSVFSWYKRCREMEADEIALEWCSRSCIDLREPFALFESMKTLRETLNIKRSFFAPSFFSDHPSFENRLKKMKDDLPKLLQIRSEANCPELPNMDPRDNPPRNLKTAGK